jgi:hypothetical protein
MWYHGWPYLFPVRLLLTVKREHIPVGEVVVRHGAQVKASDGAVGQVDAFLVDPKTRRITHLVLRKGHLWGQKDVMVPVSEIRTAREDAILLKLDKRAVDSLPAVPVRRRHDRQAA